MMRSINFIKILDKNEVKNILEVDCGPAQLARRFLRGGYSYTGIDVIMPMLEYAKGGAVMSVSRKCV